LDVGKIWRTWKLNGLEVNTQLTRWFVSFAEFSCYLKLQLLPATSQDSGEFIFQQDCRSAHNMLFYDINISQGSVATRLRWGGIFNDRFIANFLENVTVKEFWKSATIWRSYVPKALGYMYAKIEYVSVRTYLSKNRIRVWYVSYAKFNSPCRLIRNVYVQCSCIGPWRDER